MERVKQFEEESPILMVAGHPESKFGFVIDFKNSLFRGSLEPEDVTHLLQKVEEQPHSVVYKWQGPEGLIYMFGFCSQPQPDGEVGNLFLIAAGGQSVIKLFRPEPVQEIQ